MKIILANPRGFCAGVNMAIECLERALDSSGRRSTSITRSSTTSTSSSGSCAAGTVFVESLDEVPEGAPLLYSAHGVSPQIRDAGPPPQARGDRRHLPAGDQGPPRSGQVREGRVHDRPDRPRGARRGHRHDGRGPRPDGPGRDGRGRRAAGRRRPGKVAYLTQTTLSVDDANVVIAALRKKFPQIANPPKDDICYATQNRQEAVRELAARADMVLVLGSQNSSNSKRLAEIADSLGPHAHLIDGVSEIEDDVVR